MAIALLAALPSAASASATGTSYFGTSSVRGGFSSIGNICNWTMTAEFFDSSGRWYKTYSTPTRYGCSRTGSGSISINRSMKRGFMCSTLKQNGGRITSVCHNIY